MIKEEIKKELDSIFIQEQLGYLKVANGFKTSAICSPGEVEYHFQKIKELRDLLKQDE